jgi:hypothetical protein
MTDKLKPRRMGLTRTMKGLPKVSEQEARLVDADCYPVWTWAEFPDVTPSFIDGDVIVAVSSAVFGSKEWPFITEGLTDDIPKAKTGPKPSLGKCEPKDLASIEFIIENAGYPMAVRYCRDVLGIVTDRHALYHRLKRKTKKEDQG